MALPMPRRINSLGSALVTALFIMALVAIATTAMTYRLQIDLKRTQWLIDENSVNNALSFLQFWARGQLITNASQSTIATAAIDNLPIVFKKQTIIGTELEGQIDDAQARYNLNNLELTAPTPERSKAHFTEVIRFSVLLEAVLKDMKPSEALSMSVAISNIISAPNDFDPTKNQDELPTKNFVDISELRSLPSFTAERFLKISPYIVALPEVTPINLNTAALPVLHALFPESSNESLQQFIDLRNSHLGFKSMAELNSALSQLQMNTKNLGNAYTLRSNYFLLAATGRRGQQSIHLQSLLHRKIKKGSPTKVQQLWQVIS